ncbi:MAG: hypothetical protein B9S30_07770 [Verrucomicrobiia bacterium Tous-C5FEB]|nr:MAG: hypothetical protein B9S30_07770 [Verrucomicrobiae bacterium Tous-C5FEB]
MAIGGGGRNSGSEGAAPAKPRGDGSVGTPFPAGAFFSARAASCPKECGTGCGFPIFEFGVFGGGRDLRLGRSTAGGGVSSEWGGGGWGRADLADSRSNPDGGGENGAVGSGVGSSGRIAGGGNGFEAKRV